MASRKAAAVLVARSLAEASSLGPRGGPHSLLLPQSEDLQCRNMMCPNLGEVCLCKLALCLGRCSGSLQTLDLSSNGLSALPDTVLQGLPALRSLDISHNAFAAVPPAVLALPALTSLAIAGNPLKVERAQVLRIPQLGRLLLSREQMSQEGLQQLRMERPGLEVILAGEPTE